jgi:peptide/nickel transport system substrate-binding protein
VNLTGSPTSFASIAVVLLAVSACEGDGGSGPLAGASRPNEATVLLDAGYTGSWPAGLDPATNTTGRANVSQMNAIFGGLFQLTATQRENEFAIEGTLARGYSIDDEGRAFVIHLRDGMTFSDGTPFDADAVKFNIERSLRKPCTCSPSGWPWAEQNPVTAPDPLTVELHFSRPYPSVANAFPVSNINWIASPAALERLGEEQFKITPVGAGPFKVVSNQLSSRLVLERNPEYWQEGRPYLDRLIFQSIGSEQAGYQALLARDAHVYEGMTSTPLIEQALQNPELVVTQQPATAPYIVQLNTTRPPFDDRRAREAIYHATDVDAIREGLFHNWYPVSQSFTGPGGLFHHETVPGYRSYDPERARAIVQELGGVRLTLGTIRSVVAEQVITALQSQWREVGIDVTIESYELPLLISTFRGGEWQAMLATAGSFDPESGSGVSFRFRSNQQYTGVRDAELDRILDAAAASVDPHERDKLYRDASQHISDNAYSPFLFAFAPTQVAVRGIEGPGLTTKIPPILVNTAILWPDVRFATE